MRALAFFDSLCCSFQTLARACAEAEALAAAIAANGSASQQQEGTETASQISPFRTAAVRAIAASSTSAAGEPCALDALVANTECLNTLHSWLEHSCTACLAAAAAVQSGDTGSAALANRQAVDEACLALLAALVKLPVTVKVMPPPDSQLRAPRAPRCPACAAATHACARAWCRAGVGMDLRNGCTCSCFCLACPRAASPARRDVVRAREGRGVLVARTAVCCGCGAKGGHPCWAEGLAGWWAGRTCTGVRVFSFLRFTSLPLLLRR